MTYNVWSGKQDIILVWMTSFIFCRISIIKNCLSQKHHVMCLFFFFVTPCSTGTFFIFGSSSVRF